MKKLLLVLVAVVLAGCVVKNDYQVVMEGYQIWNFKALNA